MLKQAKIFRLDLIPPIFNRPELEFFGPNKKQANPRLAPFFYGPTRPDPDNPRPDSLLNIFT